MTTCNQARPLLNDAPKATTRASIFGGAPPRNGLAHCLKASDPLFFEELTSPKQPSAEPARRPTQPRLAGPWACCSSDAGLAAPHSHARGTKSGLVTAEGGVARAYGLRAALFESGWCSINRYHRSIPRKLLRCGRRNTDDQSQNGTIIYD